ncbi:MAG: NAD(P)H-hydrate dehydratase [Bacteroidales bacterium]|nr:NAD(P)H-hydrate dehydratase [Bacteroidales bacterium]
MIFVDKPQFPSFLINRAPDSHKGIYGHALLVAGSYGKMGAAVLAARACLRAGVGLLTVHVPRRGVDIMQTAVPEAMVAIDDDERIFTHHYTTDELQRYDAVAVGPGLGTQSTAALRALLAAAADLPMVLDADTLNMLSQASDGLALLKAHAARSATILTPHAKEYERLFGQWPDEHGRQAAQRQLSRDTHCIIVYKGHRTQVTDTEGEIHVNTTGNPGMATAGSGDVLTGIMLSVLAQNKDNQIDAATCATLAVWMHGKSADIAVKKQTEYSLIAGDIIENLKYVTIVD